MIVTSNSETVLSVGAILFSSTFSWEYI